MEKHDRVGEPEKKEIIGELEVASLPGNEIEAMQGVVGLISELQIPARTLERVKTAVAECTMNAMEHGNGFHQELAVKIRVARLGSQLRISICDQGGEREILAADRPDLEAKLAGLQSPRGWGLFLIEHMVDEMQVRRKGIYHIVTLIFDLTDIETD